LMTMYRSSEVSNPQPSTRLMSHEEGVVSAEEAIVLEVLTASSVGIIYRPPMANLRTLSGGEGSAGHREAATRGRERTWRTHVELGRSHRHLRHRV
jgi:hypothetical protein